MHVSKMKLLAYICTLSVVPDELRNHTCLVQKMLVYLIIMFYISFVELLVYILICLYTHMSIDLTLYAYINVSEVSFLFSYRSG